MQILKDTNIDWQESRLISKLYIDQRVQLKLDQKETSRLEENLEKDAACRRVYTTCTANTLSRKLLKVLGT